MSEFKGQAQSNGVQCIIEMAKELGYLTLDQLFEAFPEIENDVARLDDLFHDLYSQGIHVYDSKDAAEEKEEKRARVKETLDEKSNQGDGADLSRIPIDDAVGLYFAEMSEVPLLTHDEEVALAKQLERGQEARRYLSSNGHEPEERAHLERLIEQGQKARENLVEANTRLVVSVAKKYRGMGMPFLDLIQAGNEGLLKAVDKFDYRRGYKFSTYATWWIRQAVTRSLSDHGRTIRLPIHLSDRIRRVFKVAQRIEQETGQRPTPEEIAREITDLDSEKARWLLRISRRSISLDKPIGDEEDAGELGDFIVDETAPSPIQITEKRLLRESLERMLVELTPREARVLRLRFGLNGDHAHTLKEVGERIGVTRERVRQIEGKALRKLRHPRHSRVLRDYLS
jgi:RNA polymerase primary sigma factor